MSRRVVLALTMKETLEINRAIFEKLLRKSTIYLSCDSIVSNDP
jgi:hypothetical protein